MTFMERWNSIFLQLKEVRKDARQHLLEIHNPYWEYISYKKGKGFYHTPSVYIDTKTLGFRYKKCEPIKDEYAVFRLKKNGSLEPIMDTWHSKNFHNELIQRRRNREFEKRKHIK